MATIEYSGKAIAHGQKVAIVVSRFNELISKQLLAGALDELTRLSEKECAVEVFWVPGSFEIAGTAARLAEKGGYDGILALGCLIEGETDHYKLLATEVAKGLAKLAVEGSVPVGFGVLATHSFEDALNRAGIKAGNEGALAMRSLIEMMDLYGQVKK